MDTSQTVQRIKEMTKKNGYTMKHICAKLGVRDNFFTDCKHRGAPIPDDVLRSVATILETTAEYLKGETNDPNFHLSSVGMKVLPYEERGTRPVFGHASAGLGVMAQQEALGREPVSAEHDTDDYFWLVVSGDSMSPKIDDGDLVLVNREAPVETNTTMVVIVDDDQGFVKRVSVNDDTVTLHSHNPYYPPMVFGGAELARLRFIGRVVELRRKF